MLRAIRERSVVCSQPVCQGRRRDKSTKRIKAWPCDPAWSCYPTQFSLSPLSCDGVLLLTSMKLTWTKTDEAPALASYALLPILRAYFKGTGVEIETADISLAGRIIATFPERLTHDQTIPDELTRLGELAKTPGANIVKLPNISASIPQLRDAIAELHGKGYKIPDYPDAPSTDEERAVQARFAAVLGSGRKSRVARGQFRTGALLGR